MSLESMTEASPSSTPRHQRNQDMTVLATPVSAGLVSGLVCLVVVLVAFTPLFVCMPLWVDATHYDICARNLLEGGVHLRHARSEFSGGGLDPRGGAAAVWLEFGSTACIRSGHFFRHCLARLPPADSGGCSAGGSSLVCGGLLRVLFFASRDVSLSA